MTDNEALENIAANTLLLLREHHISMTCLAKKIGDTPMSISRLCRKKSDGRPGLLKRIADYFDIPVDSLLEKPPKKNLRNSA